MHFPAQLHCEGTSYLGWETSSVMSRCYIILSFKISGALSLRGLMRPSKKIICGKNGRQIPVLRQRSNKALNNLGSQPTFQLSTIIFYSSKLMGFVEFSV